jgi:hypothetical protein
VREHIALYCADTQPTELRALRTLALEWMERLAAFRPHLGGAVWHGTATRLSDIYLQLFCDDPKSAEIALINQGVNYEPGSVPGLHGQTVDVPQCGLPAAFARVGGRSAPVGVRPGRSARCAASGTARAARHGVMCRRCAACWRTKRESAYDGRSARPGPGRDEGRRQGGSTAVASAMGAAGGGGCGVGRRRGAAGPGGVVAPRQQNRTRAVLFGIAALKHPWARPCPCSRCAAIRCW